MLRAAMLRAAMLRALLRKNMRGGRKDRQGTRCGCTLDAAKTKSD